MNDLQQMVDGLNSLLTTLHQEGKSLIVGANGYTFKLQENELVQLEVRINDCEHEWELRRGPLGSLEEGGSHVSFQMCRLCNMTKDVRSKGKGK